MQDGVQSTHCKDAWLCTASAAASCLPCRHSLGCFGDDWLFSWSCLALPVQMLTCCSLHLQQQTHPSLLHTDTLLVLQHSNIHTQLLFRLAAAACTFAEANPRLMRCALGAIPAGETRTITIRCLADGSKLGLLSNVASVGCDKPSQQGVANPTCSKTSNPATVTVSRLCCINRALACQLA